jgi:hypothetical protein
MTSDELDLFHGYLDGSIGAADFARLQTLLRENAEARRMLRDLSTVDAKLQELGAANPATLRLLASPVTRPARSGWLAWNPLLAAAAGLVLGLFSASMVWGYVGPYAGRAITLLQESFESGPPPLITGVPIEAGRWSGDYSKVVGDTDGVRPASGAKMLQFLRADYEGKPGRDGYIADLFRIVDLRGSEFGVDRGDACVSVEARFRSVPLDGQGRVRCSVTVYALDALPEPGERHELFLRPRDGIPEAEESQKTGATILATATRQEVFASTGDAWQTVRNELRVPPGTRFFMVHLHEWLFDSRGPREPLPVEFSGLFVDDIRATLTHRPPLP